MIFSEWMNLSQFFPPCLHFALESLLWKALQKCSPHPPPPWNNLWSQRLRDILLHFLDLFPAACEIIIFYLLLCLLLIAFFFSFLFNCLSKWLSGHLRASDYHSSDYHSSIKAIHRQCQPLHNPPYCPHLTSNWLHQQASRPAPNHSHRARHPSSTSPSSKSRTTLLWG